MFLDDVSVDYISVLAAALVYFILGAIWYAPFAFGHRKMKHEACIPGEDKGCCETGKCCQIWAYVGEFILGLIMAFVLALFIQISGAESFVEGITVAFWIWLGFIATTHFSAVLWARKTLKSFFIHASFMLVGLILMALVITYLS